MSSNGKGKPEDSEVIGDGAVDMTVNSSGELSCSIEETNRIRALIGLKPLNTGPSKESIAVDNYKKTKDEEASKAQALVIQERLEKAKDKRTLHEFMSNAPTLGDVDVDASPGDVDLISAADWVKRSRTIAETQKEKEKENATVTAALLASSTSADQAASAHGGNYSADDLAGLGIMHNARDFQQGETVILTLADTPLLQRDALTNKVVGLHSGENDALENVNMAAEARRKDALKRIKRSKLPSYTGYDDDEFDHDDDGNGSGVTASSGVGAKKKILSQYDDAPAVPQVRLIIGKHGKVGDVASSSSSCSSSSSAHIKMEIPMSLSQPSDAGAERRVLKESNDYFTQAEYVTFKGKDKDKYNSKTSKDKDKDKSKKRKIRVKNEEEDDTGENQNKERGIGKGLEQSLAEQQQYQNHHIEQYESSTADYGSRREKHKSARTSTGMGEEDKVGNDAKEATDRLASYRHAVKTAGEKSARAFATTNSSLEVALEPELAVSFARAQRLQATSNTVDKGASWVIQQAQVQRSKASAVINDEDVVMKGTGTVIDMPDEEGRCADGKLVFTSSTVFSHKMRAMEDEKSLQRAQRIEQTQTQTQTIKVENSGTADVDMNDEQEHAYDDEQEQEQVGEKHISHTPVSAIELQPLASSSMAAALNLLKGSGDLSQTDSRLAGRAKDARKQDPAARDFDVKIDYHDEFGRKLTQKEAFRQLNYRFHGIAPGLKAQEKRLRTLEREAQHANTGMMGENTGAMQNLLHVQKATGSAHVTVSSSYKNTTGQRDESVAQLALDIHNKRIAHKEKKQQQMLNNLNTAVSSSSSSTKL